jgi:hypothetical protein
MKARQQGNSSPFRSPIFSGTGQTTPGSSQIFQETKTEECQALIKTELQRLCFFWKINFLETAPGDFKTFACSTREDVREHTYFNYSSTTTHCAATTRHTAAWALRQPCRAPRVLVSRPQRLYIDYVVRRHDVVFWAYDYFNYSSRLVSTRKLVEDGSHDINN